MSASFIKNTSFIFTSKLITFVLSFASGIVTARWLGPSGKGILSITLLVPTMAALVVSLGIRNANIYYIGQKKYNLHSILGNASLWTLTGSAVGIVILIMFFPLLQDTIFKGISSLFFILILCMIPVTIISDHLISIVMGLQRFKTQAGLTIFQRASSLLLIILLVIIFHLGVLGAIIASLTAIMAVMILNIYVLRDKMRIGDLKPIFSKRIANESIRLGLKGQIGNLLQFFNYRLDIFFVNYFLGVASVGLYTVGVAIAELLWYISDAIATVLFPKTASNNSEEANAFTPLVCRQTMLITAVGAILLALIVPVLVPFLFGKAFSPSVRAVWFLLPGIVALTSTKVLCGDLAGRGKFEYGSYAATISLVITIVLDFVLIPRMGIIGAALASTVAYTVSAVVVGVLFVRLTGIGTRKLILPIKTDLQIYQGLIGKIFAPQK